LSVKEKIILAGKGHQGLSIRQRCELLGLNRSSYYYEPQPEDEYNRLLMNLIDEEYTKHPFYGSPKLWAYLRRMGHDINIKRIKRLMRMMGIRAICPTVNTSKPEIGHKIFPYLLSGVKIVRPNQVWSVDITYIRMAYGFMYLVAIIDWYSRYVLSWKLSNTMDKGFCLEALLEALRLGNPDIFNSDQGSQFTSDDFTGTLLAQDIQISMDGKGRALDNIFVERLWRSVKYENIYLNNYEAPREAHTGLDGYFYFYNNERPHQSLNYQTPSEVHFFKKEVLEPVRQTTGVPMVAFSCAN
jgi:putative transposase